MERMSSRYSDILVDDPTATATATAHLVDVDDKVFVAVGREVKATKSTLLWALQNAVTNKVVILYVHQPAQTISILGGKFPISQLGEQEVKAHREIERQKVSKILNEYAHMCTKAGVQQVEKEYIEMASIETGIVELITKLRIGKLVMGAAADNKYSRKMIEPKSKKAAYVRIHAPPSCNVWFVCKGRLIYTREGAMSYSTGEEVVADQRLGRVASGGVGVSGSSAASPLNSSGFSTPWSGSVAGESSFDDLEQSSTMSNRMSFGLSPRSEAAGNSYFSSMRTQDIDPGLPSSPLPPRNDELHRPSVSNLSASMNDHLYEHLEQAMAETETSKRQAFEESTRRRKAEKDTVDAIRKARLAESLYFDELRRRKEVGEELAKTKEELENVYYEKDGLLEKLTVALDQKALFEERLERSDAVVKEMEEKLISVLELLKIYNKQ